MHTEYRFTISRVETTIDLGKRLDVCTNQMDTIKTNAQDAKLFDHYHNQLESLFNNAGLCALHLIYGQFLGEIVSEKRVVIMAGRGFIGDIALRTAYQLAKAGADVVVLTTAEDVYQKPTHRLWLNRLRTQGASINVGQRSNVTTLEQLGALDVDLIIDGLLGGSPHIVPTGSTAHLIHWANDDFAPVLSLCAPSGLYAMDCRQYTPVMEATITLSFIPPKPYLLSDDTADFVGDLYLGDLTVPLTDYSPHLVRAFNRRLTEDEAAVPLSE